MNKELGVTKVKFNQEKTEIHRAEIKSWRKELGEVTKEKIKLEEKLDEAQENLAKPSLVLAGDPKSFLTPASLSSQSKGTDCSICAADILNYTP